MADIARMLSKLDKALLARSELKKEPIQKNKYERMLDAQADKASKHDVGFISPYEKPRPWIRRAPRSKAGLDRNNVSSGPGLPYVKIDDVTGARTVVDEDHASKMPRMVLEPGKGKGVPGKLVPARDAKGNVIYDPIPYNYPLLLNPFSDPPYQPVDFKVKTKPVLEANGEPKLDRNGKPVMRFVYDDDGRFVPETDANGNPVPLPMERNDDGDLVQRYHIDPDYIKGRIGVHSLGVDKDAGYVEDRLANGATWDEAMEALKRMQAATLADQERNAWLKRLSTILQDADDIGVGATNEDGTSAPRYAVNRELMNWYRKDPEPEEFNEGISSRFANKVLEERNPYFSPGMPVGRLQVVVDPETGEKRLRVWHPEKGPIEFLGPTSTLKTKHVRALADALGRADKISDRKRRLAQSLANAQNGNDDGTLYHGLTLSEWNTLGEVGRNLRDDPKNPMAKEWRHTRAMLSDKIDYGDDMDHDRGLSNADMYEMWHDTDAYKKNYATVDPSRANDLAVKLMRSNPEMWGWLADAGRERDYNDIVRLFTSLPRDKAERFAETGMLDLEPRPGYKPPKHSTIGDEIKDRAIFGDLASRGANAKKWLKDFKHKDNMALAMKALQLFDTDEGKQFLQEKGYADPLAYHRRIQELKSKLEANPNDPEARDWIRDIRNYEEDIPKGASYGRGTLLDAVAILLNEKGEYEREQKEARDKDRAKSAKERITSILDDAYDIPLPEGTRFETGEYDEGRAEELRQKQLQTIAQLSNWYGDLKSLWTEEDRSKRQVAFEKIMGLVRAAYPGMSDYELQRLLEQGKEADNILRSFSPDSKGGMFARKATELLGRNPTETIENQVRQDVSDAKNNKKSEISTYDALKNIYGDGWDEKVYSDMIWDMPLKVRKVSNALVDLTKSINPRHKDYMAVLKQLKRLSGGDEDSVYYHWADSLERLMDTRAEMNDAINERLGGERNGTWNGVMDEFMTKLRRNGFNGFEDLDFGNRGGLSEMMLGDIEYDDIHGVRLSNSKKKDLMDVRPADQQSTMHGAVQPDQVRYDNKGIIVAQPASSKGPRVQRYNFGHMADVQNPLSKQMEDEAKAKKEKEKAAKRAEATLKQNEKKEKAAADAEASKVLDAPDATAAKNKTAEKTVVPKSDEDKALAVANPATPATQQGDASKRLNPTLYGNQTVSTGLNADGSVPRVEAESPSGHIGTGMETDFPDLNRDEKRGVIREVEDANKEALGVKGLDLSSRRASYKPKNENAESTSKRASIMNDMRNMSLRDMMDSIAKNSDKSGHPYGPSIGGSVFAFGCVPVNMGGDGRERGMPADIPTAKTNDEGLTKKKVSLKAAENSGKESGKIEKGYFDKLVDGPVTGSDLRVGGSDDDDLRVGGSDDDLFAGDTGDHSPSIHHIHGSNKDPLLPEDGSDDYDNDLIRAGGYDGYIDTLPPSSGQIDAETARMIRGDNMRNNDYVTIDDGYGIRNYTTKDDVPTYTNFRNYTTNGDTPTYTNPSYGVLKSIRKSLYASGAGHIAEWPAPFRKYVLQNHPEIPDRDLQEYISGEW